jgi:hypothetical protein
MKTMYTKLKLLDVLKSLALMVVFLFFGYNAQSQSSNSPICPGPLNPILLTCAGGNFVTTCEKPGASYSWYNPTDPTFTSTDKDPQIDFGSIHYVAGTYYLTVKYFESGIWNYQNGFTTVVFIDPLVPSVAGLDQTICPGGSLTPLTAPTFGGGAGISYITYTWEKRVPPSLIWVNTLQPTGVGGPPLYLVPPYTFPDFPITATTEYRLRGNDTYCIGSNPQYTNTVTITVQLPPSAGTICCSQTICYNTVPANLTGTPTGTTYTWEQFLPLRAGSLHFLHKQDKILISASPR